MYIYRITIKNFRLLKDFSIDLEKELSLVIGKNNSGKTSMLHLLDIMLNGHFDQLSFNDLNLDYRNKLIQDIIDNKEKIEADYEDDGISLRLYIHYEEDDDLDCLGLILMDLDANNHTAVLGFDYYLTYNGYKKCRTEYQETIKKKSKNDTSNAKAANYTLEQIVEGIISKKISSFFTPFKKSIEYSVGENKAIEKNYIDISKRTGFHLEELIAFGYIDARRNVTNMQNNSTLSNQTSELYNKLLDGGKLPEVNDFENELTKTDSIFSEIYSNMFREIITKVSKMGGMVENETKIKIISNLQQRELLKGNTTIVYSQDNSDLPEHYNGLGYMNLISMIFQIEIIIQGFISKSKKRLADINLLIIEEPEAHTHPQMQYVFIKNIKDILNNPISREGVNRGIQSIISTHSSHIVSESDFDDIKYMVRCGNNNVIAKNMKDLKLEYSNDEEQYFTFLKHYLTLSRSELFFADKAIFIEGDTERILLPIMMKKLDQEEQPCQGELPLTQQHISIIEVGAYSHIFGKFINFIGLKKALIITDLDICEKNSGGHPKKCKYEKNKEQVTSNNALKEYFNTEKIDDLINKSDSDKLFQWNASKRKWINNTDGNMRVCYQLTEQGYQARTFEDCFFHINHEFIKKHIDNWKGLASKKVKAFVSGTADAYLLADEGIVSKATFAVEIVYNSESDAKSYFTGWTIPEYIKEGLLWIKK